MRIILSVLIFVATLGHASAQVQELPPDLAFELSIGTPEATHGSRSASDLMNGAMFEPVSRYRGSKKIGGLVRIVGMLRTQFDGSPVASCTANLIAKDLILTNAHCLVGSSGDSATQSRFYLGYLDVRRPEDTQVFSITLPAVEFNLRLDYAILKLANEVESFEPRNITVRDPYPGEPLMLAGHPLAQPLYVTRGGCVADRETPSNEDKVFHLCDTLSGNSGSLLFSDDEFGVLVGLHRSTTFDVNVGTRMTVLLGVSPILTDLFTAASEDAQINVVVETPKLSLAERRRYQNDLQAMWRNGQALSRQGQDDEYYSIMSTALNLALQHFGPDSREVAQAQNHMIGAATTIDRVDEAISAAEDAIRIWEKLDGPKSKRAAADRANLAARYRRVGRLDEAERAWLDAIAIFENSRLEGWDFVSYSSALNGYAQFIAHTGNPTYGIELADKSISVLEESGNLRVINYGWTLANAAYLHEQYGECARARGLFAKAIEAFKASGVSPRQRDHDDALRMANRSC